MANPQLEDGYTRIANELLDEICLYKWNGSQLKIVIKVWRLTYGYNRKDHEFSRTFLQEVTGLSESTIKQELSFLIKNRILLVTKKETGTEGRKLAFNKNYEEWTIPKCGDSMKEEMDYTSNQGGQDSTPLDREGGGSGFHPPGGYDSTPLDSVEGGAIPPPYKEIRSLKKSIKEKEAMFEQFYSIYPRKLARKKVESSWRTLCKEKDFDPDRAIANTLNFLETCKLLKTDIKFLPYPATFLNQKRYEDYDVVDPEGLLQVSEGTKGGGGSALDRLLRKEMEGHGSHRRDITDEVHLGGIPELPDGR
ncbi:hypothetical protein AK95_14705 [Paenibacillus sp. LC231]|uniref:replication protein n=1 Tax=Paenibacillus sp. LC231 TaxID=1120679 RepID=UPI0008DCEA0B|nr:replication protein [Paenibacillus sp. LC231]OIB04863.1 hypothetical protein AK95_14705 [Paenibacillus sp. LC231]